MPPETRSQLPVTRLLACIALGAMLPAPPTPAADLVLGNARVYTLDGNRPWASTVVIRDGRIVHVGDDDGGVAEAGARVVDLGGRMVLPGFQDVHAHPASGGVAYTECPLFDSPDREALLARIRACAEGKPEATFVRGRGWSISLFPDGPPHKGLLDAIDDTRPLVFEDADAHALWLNSAALAAWGITTATPDPPGGVIARVPGSGEPSGTLHEAAAMNLAMDRWPAYTDAEIEAGIRFSQAYFLSLGVTAVQDAIVELDGCDKDRSLPAWLALEASGDLKMRASLSLAWQAGGGDALLERMKALRAAHHGDRLQVNTVKFWADGVAETRTAMLLEPYADQPGWSGLVMIPREELLEFIPKADAAGFQVHVHAIGDATVRWTLDAFEAARRLNGPRDARHHVNHLQFIHPDDIPRFAELDVSASFEPLWAYEDDYITYLTRPRVGPERIGRSYPIRALVDAGARVAFSSDWAVSSADPLLGIETAITHVDPLTNEGAPFLPEQRIGLAAAIAAYTIRAAELNRLEKVTGTVEPGKYADLVVLDRNLFEIPASGISDARVLATLIEGEVVYGTLEP